MRDRRSDEEQRRDVKIIIKSTKLETSEHFHLDLWAAVSVSHKIIFHRKGVHMMAWWAPLFIPFFGLPDCISAPIWLISTETLAHPCSPFLSPTKHTETFGKSSLRFMSYSYSTERGVPSAQQLLCCDKATHGDCGVWVYMGMRKIQNRLVMRQYEG